MRLAILVASVFVACASAMTLFDVTLDGEWSSFKVTHSKIYKDNIEEAYR